MYVCMYIYIYICMYSKVLVTWGPVPLETSTEHVQRHASSTGRQRLRDHYGPNQPALGAGPNRYVSMSFRQLNYTIRCLFALTKHAPLG